MRWILAALMANAAAYTMADDTAYRLRMQASESGGMLTVVPTIEGRSGAQVRYEMTSAKEGGAGRSSTSQGGRVVIGPDGQATLSRLSVSVGPKDKYTITVKVFDGAKLVAEETLRHPQ